MTSIVAERPSAPPPEAQPGPAGPQSLERLRRRLLGVRPTDRLWGWLGPLVIAAIGGGLRFWQLGRPHQLVFDETYYVKEGYSIWQYGIERVNRPTLKNPDALFTHGTPDVFGTTGDSVVHPPVGKWMIGFGEWLFGANSSFGWRFSSALVGTLSILMIGRVARRLFGSTLLGCVAALLLAVDGEHFVHSRTGLLDIFVMFWALAGFACILIDRDWARARLAAKVAALGPGRPAGRRTGPRAPAVADRRRRVPGPVLRHQVVRGVLPGDVRRHVDVLGHRRPPGGRGAAAGCAAGCCATASPASCPPSRSRSWSTWPAGPGGSTAPTGTTASGAPSTRHKSFGWIPDSLRSLWHYHQWMYHFNTTLDSFHQYRANPWSWLIQGRPTSFFYEGPTQGHDGCHVAQCSKAITSLGTPTIWWAATLAILVVAFQWLLRRDWRAGAVLSGLVGGYLPWFQYQHRTIFTFYTVAFVPWIVLTVTYVIGMALGPPTVSRIRRLVGGSAVGVYVVTTVAVFFFYWPIYTAQVIPYAEWARRMWFPSWI